MARDEDNWKGYDGMMKSLAQDPKKQFLDGRGVPRTSSLFYEHNKTQLPTMFTLRAYDFEGVPSLKRLYLEEADLVGYNFAAKHLYSWAHWEKLRNNKVLGAEIDAWERELTLKIQSEAIEKVLAQANEPGATGLAAAKFIATKGWDKPTKGRPKKADIQAEARKAVVLKDQIKEAKARINKMNKGPNE